MYVCYSLFFCFKQKTAYEMRISDWSSDVCSSDLTKPSRYFTPSTLASSIAESREVSGIGITTSMSWSGRSRRIFSPRVTPMRMRALCTAMFPIIECGRAKYTYPKLPGQLPASPVHRCKIGQHAEEGSGVQY